MQYRPAYEDGTDRGFRNVGYQYSDAGKTPKRKHITLCVLSKKVPVFCSFPLMLLILEHGTLVLFLGLTQHAMHTF
jgi:hypothetical protein